MLPVKSVKRTIEILEYFANYQAPSSLSEVSRALGYPASSTAALLHSLQQLGYLDYDPRERSYLPTIRAALLGIWINDQLLTDGSIMRLMCEFRDRTGCTIALAVQCDIEAQYIAVMRGRRAYNASRIATGQRRPLLHTAVGHVLLSLKPDREIIALAQRINAAETRPEWRVPVRDVMARVTECRQRGFGSSRGIMGPGNGMLAMLLAVPAHQPALVLGMGAPIEELQRQQEFFLEELRELVFQHRKNMEKNWSNGLGNKSSSLQLTG